MANQNDVNDYLRFYPQIMTRHERWHNQTQTGREFLQFHRDLLSGFMQWLSVNRREPLTTWIPDVNFILPANLRPDFVNDRDLLSSPQLVRANFTDSNVLGGYINGRIHSIVHNSFRPGLNGMDPTFANPMTAPRSILFWRWHGWINNVWLDSNLA